MSTHVPNGNLAGLVVAEIIGLHRAFEAWFAGRLDTMRRIEEALAPDLTFISPRGDLVGRGEILDGLRASRGMRDVGIRIVAPQALWRGDDTLLAGYEEWHDHSDYSTARRSTALFTAAPEAPEGLLWRHVHETWITPPPGWVVPPRQR